MKLTMRDSAQLERTSAHVAPKKKIAIIGCGPRGLQCLESLSRRLSFEELESLEITVFEPAKTPGAGLIYDPEQSHVLRMNFATQNIDFWKTQTNQKTERSASLIGWLSHSYPKLTESDGYIPRAIVGEYLHECFNRVVAYIHEHAILNIEHRAVSKVTSTKRGWLVRTATTSETFDEVVLTTGHEGIRGSAAVDSKSKEAFVFPVEPNLSMQRIPSGSSLLVRGFGLTSIDAVLMLTEARGGAFEDTGMIPRYLSSGLEPARINIRCRSGRPMLAKPTASVEPISDAFWKSYRDRLTTLSPRHGALDFRSDIWPIMQSAAAELLCRSRHSVSVINVDDWYRGWSRYKMNAAAGHRALVQSLAVATGRRSKDIPFALGEAWRKLYPEMVNLISFGGLESARRDSFDSISREMERIAFGPPAVNVAKLLRLIRNGIVGVGSDDLPFGPCDAVVNAVLASPHEHSSSGPLGKLIRTLKLPVDPDTGALKVRTDGSIESGVPGLAVFGRVTEGWVIGNDTLSRTLHTQIDNWADRIAGVIRE